MDDSHKNADAVIVSEFSANFNAMDAAVLGMHKDDDDDCDEMDFVQLSATAQPRAEWKGFEEADDNDDEEMEESSDESNPKLSHAKRRQELAQAADYDFDEDL